jgi:hypothetical protein
VKTSRRFFGKKRKFGHAKTRISTDFFERKSEKFDFENETEHNGDRQSSNAARKTWRWQQ